MVLPTLPKFSAPTILQYQDRASALLLVRHRMSPSLHFLICVPPCLLWYVLDLVMFVEDKNQPRADRQGCLGSQIRSSFLWLWECHI